MSVPAAPPKEVGSKVSSGETHLGYLDGVRAIAATFVAFHHALLQIDPKSTPLTNAVYQVFSGIHAHFAVDVFIVISGFCLMLPVVRGDGMLRGGAMHFFKKRARRILPPYFITMGLCLVLIWLCIGKKTGTHWDVSLPVTMKGIITHALLIHDAFNDSFTQINSVFWSISVEWRIYFLFPLLVLGWKKLGPITTTVLTVFGSYVLLSILYRTPINTQTCGVSPQYIGLFAVGMLGAGIAFSKDRFLSWLRERIPWLTMVFVMAVVVFLLTRAEQLIGRRMLVSRIDLFAGLWAMTLLVAAARTERNWLSHLLGWKPLAFLGTFAYSIYLIHAPLLQLIWQYALNPLGLGPDAMLLTLYFVAMPAVLLLSYAFFQVAERPFLNRLQKKPVLANASAIQQPVSVS